MPEVTLTSVKPKLTTATPLLTTASSPLTSTTMLLPVEEPYMQVHVILIIIMFCVVCFLLLLAFFYAFCFHCSIGPLPKDSNTDNRCSLEHEDATYKGSSSDGQSVGNIV